MSVTFRPCVLIPCYNHGAMMASVLARLAPFDLPCLVVDDGSDETTRRTLEALAADRPQMTLLRLAENSGKGAAVMLGLKACADRGFTHAVQVDADGQHAIEDIPKLLALAGRHPDALISGQPVYDDSIPRSRLYGRWITHVWVWIETLSLQLKDSMCGFRVYPIAPVLRLAATTPLGRRMDFDTEVMVRLYWQGNTSYFLPTRVTYPPDGVSHFDALKDNVRISLMHTRLFLGMLPRIPSLLMRRRSQHWAQQQEVKGLWGMRLMLRVWQLLGRKAFTALLWPVTAVYWLTARSARQASQQWLARVKTVMAQRQMPPLARLNSFSHFLRFGHAMLNKVASWRGEMKLHRDLVFSDNARRFKQVMEEMAPQAGIHLMPVTDIGPETAILIKEKLDRGEWVAIVGDRIAVTPQRGGSWRVIWSEFMGQPAPFPQGPFILASILRCPVVLIFALCQQGKLTLHCEPFADPLLLPRGERQQALQQTVDRYAQRLEHYALLSPLDWFNFFDFWQLPEVNEKE